MKVLILVDHCNLLYRAYFSSKRECPIKPWLPVLRYIDMLRLSIQRIKNLYSKEEELKVEFLFAGESKTKLDRTKIDETYKSKRVPITDPYFKTFRKIMPKVLKLCGWEVVDCDGAEADDIIATMVAKHREKKIFIFSNDRDLRQCLVFPDVVIYQQPGIFYNEVQFAKEYGFDPGFFLYFKALVGDRSDNIPGVNGWGPQKAKKHILAGDWENQLTEEERPTYQTALHLVSLNFELDCSGIVPKKLKRSVVDTLRLLEMLDVEENVKEIYSTEAFEEIGLAVARMSAA